MEKSNYKYLFILFLCLNVLLLGKFFFLNNGSNSKASKKISEKETIDIKNVNKIKSLSNAFNYEQDSIGIKLFLFFPDQYCNMCINYDLPFIKAIYDKFPKRIVIGNKSSSYNLSTMLSEKRLSETKIDNITIEHNVISNTSNPIIVLATMDGSILLARESTFSNAKARNSFYSKVALILK
jgi:hypothetical protein